MCPYTLWSRVRSWFTPSPSIEFIAKIPGIQAIHPPQPTSQLSLPWVADSKKFAEHAMQDYNRPQHGATHKCSGITKLHQQGWILTTWHDLYIETNGDGEGFGWKLPSGINPQTVPTQPIGMFVPEFYGAYPSVKFAAPTLKTIIKIHLPWTFRITRGWGLLMLPLTYTGETRFTSAIGIINPRISRDLNPILYWHVLKGQTVLKAGTPLCQVIPIPLDSPFITTIREMTPEETRLDKFREMIHGSTWVRNYRALEKVFDYEEQHR